MSVFSLNYTAGYLADRNRLLAPLQESGISAYKDYVYFYDQYTKQEKGRKDIKYIKYLQAYEDYLKQEKTLYIEIEDQEKLMVKLTQELQKQIQELQICGYQLPIVKAETYDLKQISDTMLHPSNIKTVLCRLMEIVYHKEGGKPTLQLQSCEVNEQTLEQVDKVYRELLRGENTQRMRSKLIMQVRIYDGVYAEQYEEQREQSKYRLCTYLLNYSPEEAPIDLGDIRYIEEDIQTSEDKEERYNAFKQYQKRLDSSPYPILLNANSIMYRGADEQVYHLGIERYGIYGQGIPYTEIAGKPRQEALETYRQFIQSIPSSPQEQALLLEIVDYVNT